MTTEREELEEYIEIEIQYAIEQDRPTRNITADLLDYFTNNVETYNKALEEENEFLTEQLKTVLEKFQDSVNDTQEVLGDVEQAMTLRVMGGKG